MSFLSAMGRSLLLASAALLPFTSAIPVIVHPGGVEDLVITKNNTLNATTPAGAPYAPSFDPAGALKLSFVNYLNSNQVYGYVTGLDATNQLAFLGPNGNFYYPTTSSGVPQPIPNSAIGLLLGGQGSTNTFTVPGWLTSSRIYFSETPLQFFVVSTGRGPGLVEPSVANSADPNAAVNWGFVEFNWAQQSGLFADITAVDFVGMPLGIELTDGSGTQQALGLVSNAVPAICNALQAQAQRDGSSWAQECVYTSNGQLVRVIAPQDLISQNPNAFNGYFDNYIKQVYSTYSSQKLTINTQASAGMVQCSVSNNVMNCNGDSASYPMPSSQDIFGCNSGPFSIPGGSNGVHYAVVPRLCAAFNRGTFLLGADPNQQVSGYGEASGAVQPGLPPSSYYTNGGPYNYYSAIVHQYEWNGLGYAYSYDDVTPQGNQNVAGTVQSGSPNVFTVLVGGYDLA